MDTEPSNYIIYYRYTCNKSKNTSTLLDIIKQKINCDTTQNNNCNTYVPDIESFLKHRKQELDTLYNDDCKITVRSIFPLYSYDNLNI